MNRYWISALAALFSFVSTAHADNVSITPGTGGIGFNPDPITTVPEPATFLLVASVLLILIVFNLIAGLRCFTSRVERTSEYERKVRR